MQRGVVNVVAPSVTDLQAMVPIEPGKRAPDNPTVAAKTLARLDATPSDRGMMLRALSAERHWHKSRPLSA